MSISDRTTWPWGVIAAAFVYGNTALAYVATDSVLWAAALGLLGLATLTLGRVLERVDRTKGDRHVDQ